MRLSARFTRVVDWFVVGILILAAIAVTTLRLALPSLDEYTDELCSYIQEQSGLAIQVQHMQAAWRDFGPVLLAKDVELAIDKKQVVKVKQLELDIDFWPSIWALTPQFKKISINNLDLDLTKIIKKSATDKIDLALLSSIIDKSIFLQQGIVAIKNSKISFISPSQKKITLDLNNLFWTKKQGQHLINGLVSIVGPYENLLEISANLNNLNNLSSMNGDIYVRAHKFNINSWLSKQIKTKANLNSSDISFQIWSKVTNGSLDKALIDFAPSSLSWQQQKQKHKFVVDGNILVNKDKDNWQIFSNDLNLSSDKIIWDDFSFAVSLNKERALLNTNKIKLAAITPLLSLLEQYPKLSATISKIKPKGELQDLKLALDLKTWIPTYSLILKLNKTIAYKNIPSIKNLQVNLEGIGANGRANLSVNNGELNYPNVLVKPLIIHQSELKLLWTFDKWLKLWSDKFALVTPDINLDSQFRLDFINPIAPHLSASMQIDVKDASHTGLYLPVNLLPEDLTRILTDGITKGHINNGKLLWFGELSQYPFAKHNGIFLVDSYIDKAKFSFDPLWPTLNLPKIRLWVKNAALGLSTAKLDSMELQAQNVQAIFPDLMATSKLKITANIKAPAGKAVRDYMLATPLDDTLGSALTQLDITGAVSSSLDLTLLFDKFAYRAKGKVKFKNNALDIPKLGFNIQKIDGNLFFDNETIKAKKIKAKFLGQNFKLDLFGQDLKSGYAVNLKSIGNLQTSLLQKQSKNSILNKIKGLAKWNLGIDLLFNKNSYTYNAKLQSYLKDLEIDLPEPFAKKKKTKKSLVIDLAGKDDSFNLKAVLPKLRYQAKFKEQAGKLKNIASQVLVGFNEFIPLHQGTHELYAKLEQFSLQKWLPLVNNFAKSSLNNSYLPFKLPQHYVFKTSKFIFKDFIWHKLVGELWLRSKYWRFDIKSKETTGTVSRQRQKPIKIDLKSFFLRIPSDYVGQNSKLLSFFNHKKESSKVSTLEKDIMRQLPQLDIAIDKLWLQGYLLGKVEAKFRKLGNSFSWQDLSITSGTTSVLSNGKWRIDQGYNNTSLDLQVKSDNNSEIMYRFGALDGIQDASLDLNANLSWNGTPWGVFLRSLRGDINFKMKDGLITSISGRKNLIGVFSLDSLVRKMQFDFSGIFDKGLAFNSLLGNVTIKGGILMTQNVKMDAIAGEMTLNGTADLNTEQVNARVKFVPDFASGLPVITAFAVTPYTGAIVFAVTTVLSPILDVITQVNYKIYGNIAKPKIIEASRHHGEYRLPEKN